MTKLCFVGVFFSRLCDFLLEHKNRFKLITFFSSVCYFLYRNGDLFNNPQCLVEMSPEASKIFREPEFCDFCENVTNVDELQNISPRDFHMEYAKTGRPVIIKDGMRDWSASTMFTFEFFKNLYETTEEKTSRKGCQFFPYKTEFKSLREVFAMSESRANLVAGEKPWYVGWSNCIDKAGKILRKYYSKPYFLGNYSENIALSWIFMGGPGNGAQMHVDNVLYTSWQAQLKGKKIWKLVPPPECHNICQTIDILVEPGDIIVVDTNRWYHQTIVSQGEVSITIGSEFD
ncbi:hypothetical protein JTB14_010845 [Gonioctena quinquepunctata]|nr:hypothetical protein JTB14_010845 [Gonioctena quinquepunctata]